MSAYQEEAYDIARHASVTVQGTPSALRTILKIWTGHSNLRKIAQLSRTWLGPDEGSPQGITNAPQYIYQLQRWCENNPNDSEMGFPYPWDPRLCGCSSTLKKHIPFKEPLFHPTFSVKEAREPTPVRNPGPE